MDSTAHPAACWTASGMGTTIQFIVGRSNWPWWLVRSHHCQSRPPSSREAQLCHDGYHRHPIPSYGSVCRFSDCHAAGSWYFWHVCCCLLFRRFHQWVWRYFSRWCHQVMPLSSMYRHFWILPHWPRPRYAHSLPVQPTTSPRDPYPHEAQGTLADGAPWQDLGRRWCKWGQSDWGAVSWLGAWRCFRHARWRRHSIGHYMYPTSDVHPIHPVQIFQPLNSGPRWILRVPTAWSEVQWRATTGTTCDHARNTEPHTSRTCLKTATHMASWAPIHLWWTCDSPLSRNWSHNVGQRMVHSSWPLCNMSCSTPSWIGWHHRIMVCRSLQCLVGSNSTHIANAGSNRQAKPW